MFQKPNQTQNYSGNQNYKSQSSGGMNKSFQDRPQMTYLNEQIKAPNIMILDLEGNNIGTFPRYKALEMAQNEGKDLVQVKYDKEKMISIAKIVDYGKYMYEKQKAEKESRKNKKEKELKEIKFGFAIGDNDLNLKIKKAEELLKEGYNVRFIVRLKGRENMYAEKVREKLKFVMTTLSNAGKTQFSEPKREAQGYSVVLFTKTK